MGLGAATGISGVGSLIGGIGSIFSANKQAEAENAALQTQKQIAGDQLNFEKQVYGDTKTQQQPFLQAGQSAIGELSRQFGTGGPTWNQTFTPPNAITEQNDPGYQERLRLGQQAMDRSAAARGNLLTGGTAKAEQRYGQDYASNEYGNVYNRAANTYATNQNTFRLNESDLYNRLAGIAGTGQTSAGQLSAAAQGVSSNTAGTSASLGNQVGQTYGALGGAQASGYAGLANAAIGGTNNISSLLYLQKLFAPKGGGIPQYPPTPEG